MKTYQKVALFALLATSYQVSAAPVYSVGLRLSAINQNYEVGSLSHKESNFGYGLELNSLSYAFSNVSMGWAVDYDYSSMSHGSLGKVKNQDMFVGPIFSYRIASQTHNLCGCNYIRVHDGISIYAKPMANVWKAKFSGDSEQDIDFAWAVGLKYQSTSNFYFGLEFLHTNREVVLTRHPSSAVEMKDKRTVMSFGYRF